MQRSGEIINARINAFQGLQPEYSTRMLSNHLPMALFALHRLGGDEAALDRFAATYVSQRKLEPAPAPRGITLTSSNWREHLGTRRNYADYRIFMTRELEQLGKHSFLTQYFGALAPGLSAGAFHGLIRLAYGVDSGNDDEVVSGIAYLADAYLELQGDLPEVMDDVAPLGTQLGAIGDAMALGRVVLPEMRGVIFQKMALASRPDVLGDLRVALPRQTTLEDFVDVCLDLYLSTKDFSALHTVTGCHALRIMLPYVENRPELYRYFCQALIAIYLTMGAPPFQGTRPAQALPSIEAIKSAACASQNDHDLKLTYSALQEWQAYQRAGFLHAAAARYSLPSRE